MSKKLSFDERLGLYWDDYNSYLFELLKDVIPRQLVKCVEYDIITKRESLCQHINSIVDSFNIIFEYEEDFPKIRKDVEKILRNRYGYIIKQDTPMITVKINNK